MKLLCNFFMSDVMSFFNENGFSGGTEEALAALFNLSTDGKYRYGQIRIWGTAGYASSSQVAAILLDITDPKWIFLKDSEFIG